MKRIRVPALERDVSVLAFGCASLGSRVSEATARRAVDRAIDGGIDWFDVAPPYGDGEAEEILGRLLAGRRERVVICTKYGIARPRVSSAAKIVRPIARKIVEALPAVRRIVGRGRAVGRPAPIEPGGLAASVARSLKALRTDRIDVLAIHEPTVDDVSNPALREAAHRSIESGQVRALAIAGPVESIAAAVATGWRLDVAQFAAPFPDDHAAVLREKLGPSPPLFVTHGVFGAALAALKALPQDRRAALEALARQHDPSAGTNDAEMLLRLAFARNPDGLVLTSMLDPRHVEANLRVASKPASPDLAASVLAVTRSSAAAIEVT